MKPEEMALVYHRRSKFFALKEVEQQIERYKEYSKGTREYWTKVRYSLLSLQQRGVR